MLRYVVFSLLMMSFPPPAEAAQNTGGTGGGSKFSCDASSCICNGTYTDCKDMEDKCLGKIKCPAGGTYCSCTKKAAIRQKLLPKSKVAPDESPKIAPQ